MRCTLLLLSLLGFAPLAGASGTPPALDAAERDISAALQRAAPLVVRLQAADPTPWSPYGNWAGGYGGFSTNPWGGGFGTTDPAWTRWTTGFLWDHQGHVVAASLPNGSGGVHVLLASGKDLAATTDRPDDPALLRVLHVEPAPVGPLPIGDPRALEPGALLIVVAAGANGTPGAYPCTLASVETAPAPRLTLSGIPGNSASGAPVLNRRGELVAVLLGPAGTAYEAGSAGLALPIDAAKPMIDLLAARTPAGYLGIGATSLQAAEGGTGLVVGQVLAGTPAAMAGVQRGDVLMLVAGQGVRTRDELAGAVRALGPGNRVELTILRKGERIQVPVTLAGWPGDPWSY